MSTALELDAVVIGAGVVGLAVARALSRSGREVTLVEREPRLGAHASSRNSEVIHAGLYYPTGSLKAELCVAGRRALYAYCEEASVEHARLGKIILATRDEEIPALERILTQARANGVDDVALLDAAEVRDLEPEVRAVCGLYSPSTGIVDSDGLMHAYRRDAVAAGAQVLVSTPVLAGRVESGGLTLELGGSDPVTARCRTLVNAAGLFAPSVSRSLEGADPSSIPAGHYAKGHYFVLSGRSPFRHLVYPIPTPGGLGVHVTLDLAGRARFGPDVLWVDTVDYTFDETRAASFYDAVRSYYPALADGSLQPGYTGIRAKLGPAGSPARDFVIEGPDAHGVPGLVALYGIESPGLTASIAIAEHVLALSVPSGGG
jgi:L-2-hydroxyglutarate oxidase LhgO